MSILHLAVTSILGVVTFVCVVIFPLFPAWVQLLAEIERVRCIPFLASDHTDRIPTWDWKDLWNRVRSVIGWRQLVLTIVVVTLLVVTWTLVVLMLVIVGCAVAVAYGRGINFDNHVILTSADPIAYRIFAIALLVMLCAIGVYFLSALAMFEVFVTRAVWGTAVTERQIARFTERNTELISAFEVERQRIERELHDGPQQHLASAAIQLGVARNRLGDSSADPQLEAAQSEIEAAASALRSALTGLRPRTLLEDGLGADITEMAALAPIPVEVSYEAPGRLDPAIESSLHFIVAEFLANTYKHAHATCAHVSAWEEEEVFFLEMDDDGVGGAAESEGTGIAGMMNRARLMGGTLRMTSPLGGPTVARFSLPGDEGRGPSTGRKRDDSPLRSRPPKGNTCVSE